MESDFNVNLFWAVTFCGIICAFIPALVRMVLQIITRETDMENNLRRQVCDLKAELGSISMVDEFAKYAKIKRKINKATDELTHQSDVRTSYKMRMHLIYTASLYAVLGCTVVFLLWNYRKEPIVILPRNWLYPFESLLSYPSDVPGSISLTSWLFVTSTAAKAMAKSLKL